MFNKDFYPTPESVIEIMGIDCSGKVVLEPSAGKGNIVDWLKNSGAKEVLVCESNKDLAEIVKHKGRFLGNDFLKISASEISHIQLIVMNPPFSKGMKHVLHAWEIAPDGCEVISLINYDNLDNDYSSEKRQLVRVIEDYGSSVELGDVFSDAERKTGVNVGLIKLYKPAVSSENLDGFFMDQEVEEQGEGIMRFDAIRDIVQRYVNAVKCFNEHQVVARKMESLTEPFDVGKFTFEIGYNNTVTDKESFAKELQKKAWQHVFNQMNLNKYVTSGVMKDINRFVETQTKVPFTMKNIYRMFEIIVGTREQTFNRSLVEAVDHFTTYTHENRFNVEGWKTNEGHLLNPKFIVPYMVEGGWSSGMRLKTSNNSDKIKDLMKVLCSLTGNNYDNYQDLYKGIQDKEFGKWFDWGFFEVRGYKKGTMHFKFKEAKVWEILNRRYAKIKGQVLPEKFRMAA